MKIALTPGQAVSIHGWFRARQTLSWGDVILLPGLNFGTLLNTYRVTEQDLYLLQPDIKAWVKAGKAGLPDCPRMKLWDAHPVKDFNADLADIIAQQWSCETLHRTGVTYADLQDLGLTAETMNLFNFTLMMWATLGFQRRHAEPIHHNLLFRLFSMSKQDVLACLK
jgi:hypothetical protein